MGGCCSSRKFAATPIRLHLLRVRQFFELASSLCDNGLGLHIFNGSHHGIYTYEQSVICVSKKTGRIVRIRLSDFVRPHDLIMVVEYDNMCAKQLHDAHGLSQNILNEQIGMRERHWSSERNEHLASLCWRKTASTIDLTDLESVYHIREETDQTDLVFNADDLCPICFDTLEGSAITSLPCKHNIHHACFNQQLFFGIQRCSLCRSKVLRYFYPFQE